MNDAVELLSPARDYEAAVAAVNSGADAVYIGADRFSARKNASNTLSEIARVISYAHVYYCRVYVALNTLLFESELEPARKLIYDLYDAGADAVIFQDASILEMDLPPIRLHASTQFNNYSPERIKFLSDSGIDRIILARELTLDQIRNISRQTDTELEVFIHGALCVSMSGRCYMSYAVGSRSANRGECAQPCRKKYVLYDSENRKIGEKYYLSMKDLDRSMYIEELIAAGISSFKIEGRLKGADYVKNVTAYYRKKIDSVLDKTGHVKSGSGYCTWSFTPDPYKTFNRGFTDFNFLKKNTETAAVMTPKSLGEYAGKIISAENDYLRVDTNLELSAGDGICFFNESGLSGATINRVEGDRLYFRTNVFPVAGESFYRNSNIRFQKVLDSADSAIRRINTAISINNECIAVTDSDGNKVTADISKDEIPQVENRDNYMNLIEKAFRKTGDTVFNVSEIFISDSFNKFYKISELNGIRRALMQKLYIERLKNYPLMPVKVKKTVPYYTSRLDSADNVTNTLAENFYRKRNVSLIESGIEKSVSAPAGYNLMESKYCIMKETGLCMGENTPEGYYIENENGDKFSIVTDCLNCTMYIKGKCEDEGTD